MSPASVCILPTALWIMSIREETPTTASGPASPPPRRWFPDAPKIVGLLRIMPLFMAFLYQSTLMSGTDGGFRLNEPEMEKCGILICGRLHSKSKMPLSQSTTPDTKERTFSKVFVKAERIPSRIFVAVDLMDSSPEDTPDWSALMVDVTCVWIPVQTVDTVDFTASKTDVVVERTAFQPEDTAELTADKTDAMAEFIDPQADDVAELTALHAEDVADVIALMPEDMADWIELSADEICD